MARFTAYSRTHSTPANSPWNQNLWTVGSRLYNLRSKLGENECIFGENMYAEHSIHYDKLNSDFYMFSACKENEDGSVQFYNWEDTLLMSEVLNIPTVPVIADRIFTSEKEFQSFIEGVMKEPSAYGPEKEGVVIRIADSFNDTDFSKCVLKYVRANHVQADEHWTKTWKRNIINYEVDKSFK